MSLGLLPVSLSSLSDARQAHFHRLREAPELYIELMLAGASAYLLTWKGRNEGYCVVSGDGCLLEIDLAKNAWQECTKAFRELDTALQLTGVRCYSFDSLLLGSCLELGWVPRIEGCLYRDLLEIDNSPLPGGLTFRLARAADADAIRPHREGVFEDDCQVDEWIAHGRVHVLEANNGWIGIGLVSPVWAFGTERDVGVMVAPQHRNQGYGALICRTLMRRCMEHDLRPTGGCAVENTASRRTLSRAGFASQHQLLFFERTKVGPR